MPTERCCPKPDVFSGDLSAHATLFKALADPYRLTILATLARAQAEVCVCDFTEALPLNQPAVSHHLRILREANLVSSVRRGTWVYYTLYDGAAARLASALELVLPRKVLA